MDKIELEDKSIEVICTVDIRDVIDKKFHSHCPFCDSSNFYVNKTNYLCQGCDACGDSIAYLMSKQCFSFEEAVVKLFNASRMSA